MPSTPRTSPPPTTPRSPSRRQPDKPRSSPSCAPNSTPAPPPRRLPRPAAAAPTRRRRPRPRGIPRRRHRVPHRSRAGPGSVHLTGATLTRPERHPRLQPSTAEYTPAVGSWVQPTSAVIRHAARGSPYRRAAVDRAEVIHELAPDSAAARSHARGDPGGGPARPRGSPRDGRRGRHGRGRRIEAHVAAYRWLLGDTDVAPVTGRRVPALTARDLAIEQDPGRDHAERNTHRVQRPGAALPGGRLRRHLLGARPVPTTPRRATEPRGPDLASARQRCAEAAGFVDGLTWYTRHRPPDLHPWARQPLCSQW